MTWYRPPRPLCRRCLSLDVVGKRRERPPRPSELSSFWQSGWGPRLSQAVVCQPIRDAEHPWLPPKTMPADLDSLLDGLCPATIGSGTGQ
jgi:hypothetical protein